MVKLYETGAYLLDGSKLIPDDSNAAAALAQAGVSIDREKAKAGTIAAAIIDAHNTCEDKAAPRLKFDSLTAHDITYVGIIQTARASGMTEFPLPIAMTNCHNSLCAVGGTINQDDHMFALSAAKKYGGIYVPPHLAVMHSYNREMMAKCGNMILGSDSHTRYGALGTMAVGEGGGELAKQLLGRTYDFARPQVIGIYLTGKPQRGVGAHDVAIAIIGATYKNGYVKNKVMEFIGDGIASLPVEFRNGIDVMTTETTCWSSIWVTDDKISDYYKVHGRPQDYKKLAPADVAYYDGIVYIDLAKVEPMIAMPFHPSNAFTIRELKANAAEILAAVEADCKSQLANKNLGLGLPSKLRGGEIYVDQGVVAGCAGGTFDNICDVANIVAGKSVGNDTFSLSVYPGSQPAYMELVKNGSIAKLMAAGAIVRSAFCGPCFGAGDTPANGEFSIRHTTRNFPNREGSKPGEGQLASVALMDAHSIAATAINGGRLTAATDIDMGFDVPKYYFDKAIYENRVYDGFGNAKPEEELVFGPNIKDWPDIPSLTENLLLRVTSLITDPVTTTDELIPSGETSSFRSNPLRLAEFTLSRKDPEYVDRAKAVNEVEVARRAGTSPEADAETAAAFAKIKTIAGFGDINPLEVGIGSTIYAVRPGDGSAREQAASCQRVLGAWANICLEYATKRYRSNLINWGMVPFQGVEDICFENGDFIFVPGALEAVKNGNAEVKAYVLGSDVKPLTLQIAPLTEDERRIIIEGCLINYYRD